MDSVGRHALSRCMADSRVEFLIWKSFTYNMMLGAIAGNVLGAWLVWQHDVLADFLITQRSTVGGRLILYVAVFGGAFGWSQAWCAAKGTQLTGTQLWGPVALGLLLSLAVTALWTHVALTTTSLPLLAIVLIAFALPATLLAAPRFKMES